MTHPRDVRRLADLAAAHHGLLPRVELDRLGVSLRRRRLAVERGEWRRVGRSLVVASAPATFELRTVVALETHPDGALSHQTSRCLHDDVRHDGPVHVTIPDGGQTRSPVAVLHRRVLDPVDVTRRRGLPVTTIERTLVDLGATMSAAALQACIEDQLARRTTTFDRVHETFARLARPGRTGIARTRAVLQLIDGDPPSESALESRFVRLVHGAGLPRPERQVAFEWSTGERGRVDVWFAAARLVVELDGRRFHARLDAFERDRRRDQAALLDGVRTVRITHRQLTEQPAEVVALLRQLLDSPPIRA